MNEDVNINGKHFIMSRKINPITENSMESKNFNNSYTFSKEGEPQGLTVFIALTVSSN